MPDVVVIRLLRLDWDFGAHNGRKRLREPFPLVRLDATGRGNLPFHGDELRFSRLTFRRESSGDMRIPWNSSPYPTSHVDQEAVDSAPERLSSEIVVAYYRLQLLPHPSCFVDHEARLLPSAAS